MRKFIADKHRERNHNNDELMMAFSIAFFKLMILMRLQKATEGNSCPGYDVRLRATLFIEEAIADHFFLLPQRDWRD